MTDEPKKKNGGRRPGSGRKLGSISERTKYIRDVSDKALREGVTPLEVMLENMRFYWTKADELLANIIARSSPAVADTLEAGAMTTLLTPEQTVELLTALQDLGSFRKAAQACAVDAAPFVHPQLARVTVAGDPKNPLQVQHFNDADALASTLSSLAARAGTGSVSSDTEH